MEDLVGIEVADQSGWSTNLGNGMFSGNRVSLGSSNAELLVDMGQEYTFAGITLISYYYAYNSVEIWYSTDNVVFEKVGSASKSDMYYNDSGYYPPHGIAFFSPITARHLKLVINNSYPYIYCLNIMQTEAIPVVYSKQNVLSGKITFTPDGSAVGSITGGGIIQASTNTPAESGYTVNLTQDDSLIEAYNAANGTSYKALPSSNLEITGIPATIGPNAYKSDNITIALTGDLTPLNDENGYLVPLKLEAAGLTPAEVGGVVYVKVAVEHNNIKSAPTGPEGTQVSDYSNFTAESGNGATISELFDNNLYNYTYANYDTIIIDCGAEYNIKSIRLCTLYGYYSSSYYMHSCQIELSSDKAKWTSMGTATAAEHLHYDDYDGYQTAVLIVPTKARYIKLTNIQGGNYYYGIEEVDVFVE